MLDFRQIAHQACRKIADAKNLTELEQLRIEYLGKKGIVTTHLKTLHTLSEQERPEAGQVANRAKQDILNALKQRQTVLKQSVLDQQVASETVDVSLAGRRHSGGSLHPVSRTLRRIETFFLSAGFTVEEGPEIEDEFYNFEALNIPAAHPARAMHDTFYLSDGHLLRTHTSPVQIRVMQQHKPPIRMIAPGRVYRRDFDVTHSPMFHQVEGLVVRPQTSFSELKGIVTSFLRAFFDDDIAIRFRPSYFPFTEPSAEVDIAWREGKKRDWLEVMGCGMVHPAVFKAVGYDATQYNGYAFGLGVERLAMLRYCISDLRLLFENDVRFIKQFYL